MKDITVVTYCHDKHRSWIPFWISQLNAQTFRDFKIMFIMHNWPSGDGAAYMHEQLNNLDADLRADLTLKSFKSRPLIGEVINFALGKVDTKYFAHWDVDDPVHPERMKLQAELLASCPDVDFLAARMVGFYGTPTKEMQQLDYQEPNELSVDVVSHNQIYDCLLNKHENCLGHTTMIYKVEVMKQIGGFSMSDVKVDGLSPDFETWKKALRAGYRFHRLPQLCALWRLDSSSMRF
jgi:hypothetical protein